MYSAHRFAKIAGVTLKMLRHYESRGLLSPQRTDAGHRRYSYRDLQQLERVLSLRGLGLSLKDVAAITQAVGGWTCACAAQLQPRIA